MACPPIDLLARISRELETPDAGLRAHLESCGACREKLESLRAPVDVTTSMGSGPTYLPGAEWDENTEPSVRPLAPKTLPQSGPKAEERVVLSSGTRVGRYDILEVLGAGGAGVVYAAHDPELDRKVALKLLALPERLRPAQSEGRARLLREAQAMARLTHSNVVAVYDAGTFEGQVFIAMELLRGGNLREWLARPRGHDEVLCAFLEAGRGLSAAHRAGLVHRDFKPENVLVSANGSFKVSDFGLVRAAGSNPEPTEPAFNASELRGPLVTPLTVDGAILGTPGYMAPEQVRGGVTGAQSDQFSFCVSLYEALYGFRPFAGESLGDLVLATLRGQVRPPPEDSAVPRRVRKAVMRGLSARPEKRFPSMDALLSAIAPGKSFTRRHWLALARSATVIGAVVLGGGFFVLWRQHRCDGVDDGLAGVWDGRSKEAIRQAFTATGAPFAEDAWRGAESATDSWAKRWQAMRRNACEATLVRGDQSGEVMVLRQACLEERLLDLRELARLWSVADQRTVEEAVLAATRLPPLEPCSAAQVRAEPGGPEGQSAEARTRREELQRKLSLSRAQLRSGAYPAGLASAKGAVQEAQREGDRGLEAEALLLRGQLEMKVSDRVAAEKSLREAARAGEVARRDEVTASARVLLVRLVGTVGSRFAEGHELARDALASVQRVGEPDALRAEFLSGRADLLRAEGRFAEALRDYEEALSLSRRAAGPRDLATADLLSRIGLAQFRMGKATESLAGFDAALGILERALGPRHPEVARVLVDKGNALFRLGDYEEAIVQQRRALEIREAAQGPGHVELAGPLTNIGNALRALGRVDEALEHQTRAAAIAERAYGDAPKLSAFLGNLSEALLARGEVAEALRQAERAVAQRQKGLPPDHPDQAGSLVVLGRALASSGRTAEAVTALERAVSLRQRALGASHPLLGEALTALGQVQLDAGRPALAVEPLEKAVELLRSSAGDETGHAIAELSLARAVWAKSRDEARARALLTSARAVLEGRKGAHRSELEALRALEAKLPAAK